MRIAVAFDHGGVPLRTTVIVELMSFGHSVLDLGADDSGSADAGYVTTAHVVARAILAGDAERGVVVSLSGVGPSFVANRIEGIRAGAPTDVYGARHGVGEGMNLLCLGAGTLDADTAAAILTAFVADEPAATAARYDRRYAGPARAHVRLTAGSDRTV
jgi:ribose 5-phosphate isomerase B